jgi:hypothetical protein
LSSGLVLSVIGLILSATAALVVFLIGIAIAAFAAWIWFWQRRHPDPTHLRAEAAELSIDIYRFTSDRHRAKEQWPNPFARATEEERKKAYAEYSKQVGAHAHESKALFLERYAPQLSALVVRLDAAGLLSDVDVKELKDAAWNLNRMENAASLLAQVGGIPGE